SCTYKVDNKQKCILDKTTVDCAHQKDPEYFKIEGKNCNKKLKLIRLMFSTTTKLQQFLNGEKPNVAVHLTDETSTRLHIILETHDTSLLQIDRNITEKLEAQRITGLLFEIYQVSNIEQNDLVIDDIYLDKQWPLIVEIRISCQAAKNQYIQTFFSKMSEFKFRCENVLFTSQCEMFIKTSNRRRQFCKLDKYIADCTSAGVLDNGQIVTLERCIIDVLKVRFSTITTYEQWLTKDNFQILFNDPEQRINSLTIEIDKQDKSFDYTDAHVRIVTNHTKIVRYELRIKETVDSFQQLKFTSNTQMKNTTLQEIRVVGPCYRRNDKSSIEILFDQHQDKISFGPGGCKNVESEESTNDNTGIITVASNFSASKQIFFR
ncbi:unnamed protein product, partial [Didymodactylos carnosus]